jgi:hypothetical protein
MVLQVQLAASVPVSEDVPVPGGTAAVAFALGLEAVPDRARFVAELTRLVPEVPRKKGISVSAALPALVRQPAGQTVPLPLTPTVWGEAVFHRRVPAEQLLFAILGDTQATLLCRGLSGLDDDTLAYFANHEALLSGLYLRSAPAFAVFSGSLRIRNDRIVPPGGDRAVPLWEAVVGQSVGRPDAFVLALFAQRGGRTAYLYDTIGSLDQGRRSFALGFWMDQGARMDAMRALVAAWSTAFRSWGVATQPFTREPHDAAMALMVVRTDAVGAPSAPSSRTLWSRAFESAALPDEPAKLLGSSIPARPIDAAWLVGVASGDAGQRSDRIDQLAFGQRTFDTATNAEMGDVLIALRAFPRYRMLLLTLERMGMTAPRTFAAAARSAARVSALNGKAASIATSEFQGGLGLLHRLKQVGTIDGPTAQSLVDDFARLPFAGKGPDEEAVATWIDSKLRPLLPAAASPEESMLLGLAGAVVDAPPIVSWEGRRYRVDIVSGERRRLLGIRDRQAVRFDLAVQAQAGPGSSTDDRLADALLSVVYAAHLGDPDGAARLAGDISRRHDFGFGARDGRGPSPWSLPKEAVAAGVPWHVEGSLLGLDVALAPLGLRRLRSDRDVEQPALTLEMRDAFVVSLALMDPRALDDSAADAVVSAIEAGRLRLATLGLDQVEAVADDARLDGWRRRALKWTVAHEPAQAEALFTLAEMLALGDPSGAVDAHAWGMSAIASSACLCIEIPSPGRAQALAGRPEPGILATLVSDLNLHVARTLRQLGLPAMLAPAVLSAAVQDFVDEVRPIDPDDWLTLARAARLVSRERIEDYVAAAAARGPLVLERP